MNRQHNPILSISHVSKLFGSVRAVDDVSLDIREGEFFSLLGASGSGKTTLLRMIGGFERVSSGEIYIAGAPVSALRPSRRPTNMVFQSYAIFPHLNVRQNIGYGLANRRLDQREIAKKLDWALNLIKMSALAERMPNELSGGQRQRLALARALVCEPKILLLDEPLSALDKQLREEMQLELRQLQRSVGITFILVTHDQEEALNLSDRVAVMSQGRVLQVDSATNLYETPNCREVARFIGSMNFIDGRITGKVNGYAILDAGQAGQLRITSSGGRLTSELATLAVRPEKLRIEPADGSDKNNLLRGKVAAESYFGDRIHYYVEIAGLSRPLIISEPNGSRNPALAPREGSAVSVAVPPDGAILFPRDDR